MLERKINELIEEIVSQRVKERCEGLVEELANYKTAFLYLAEKVRSERDYAHDLVTDYAKEGLKIGAVEAEGYMRCIITIHNFLSDLECNNYKLNTR